MKTWMVMAGLVGFALWGFGAEAFMEVGGQLTLNMPTREGAQPERPPIRFLGRLATEGWSQTASSGGFVFPDRDGVSSFTMPLGDRTVFKGTARMERQDDHAVRVRYAFQAEEAITLASLYVTFQLPVPSVTGW